MELLSLARRPGGLGPVALVLGLTLVGCARSDPAVPAPVGEARINRGDSQQEAGDDSQEEESPFKDWDEVVEGADVLSGLFNLYRKGAKLYWEIAPEQFDREYLVVVQYSRGIGDYFLLGGLPLRRDVVRFQRRGDRVLLSLPSFYTYAEPGTPMADAVENSYGSSVLASLKIESEHDSTGAVLVDMKNALVSDWAGMAQRFKLLLGTSGSLDSGRSSLAETKAFPRNLEIDVDLTFRYEGDRPLPTVPFERYVPIGVHYSWFALPDPPMRARAADDRIGHFVAARMNFSRDTAASFFERHIQRWRLEKADPDADPSQPVQPIVFYIDRTVPQRWRPYVRRGIENWNRAFEAVGYADAVVAREAPDDPEWEAEDARYSTIRWVTPFRGSFAIGPRDVDPRTGEILNADILISASVVQAWRSSWERIAAPSEAIRAYEELADLYGRLDPEGRARLCFYAQGLEREAAFVRSVLLARGIIAPGEPVPEAFIGSALVSLVMHEVGHGLGLRHNFKASSATPRERLHDASYTGLNGISASVMDYNAINVAAEPAGQGQYFMEDVGPYDIWAIEYAYKPIASGDPPQAIGDSLDAIVRRGIRDPLMVYGSDEDALPGPAGIDPLTQRDDLGSSPLGFARDRTAITREVLARLEDRVLADGESYYRLRGAFNSVLSERWRALFSAAKLVGGTYVRRLHRGDAGGAAPFAPVPAAEQREALAFVIEEAFAGDAFSFSPALLNRLTPSRWLHWGADPFRVPVDYPIHEVVLAIQSSLLGVMLHPITLTRILDAELKANGEGRPFTLAELFAELSRSVWSEVFSSDAPSEIGGFRRGIQRRYLMRLTDLLLQPGPGAPEDARALARLHLSELRRRIRRMLGATPQRDGYTRAHLEDSLARIEAALDASVTIAVPRR